MWASPRRLRLARTAIGLLNLLGAGAVILVFVTGDIVQLGWVILVLVAYYLVARFGFLCARCGKSPVLWAARHAESVQSIEVASRPDCPLCGLNTTFPDEAT